MRLAGRLCLQLGIDDPEKWLASTEKRVVDFWLAYDRIEPIGDRWLQTSILASSLSRIEATLFAANGAKGEVVDFREFMPARWIRDKPPKKKKSGISMMAMRRKLEGKK